MKLNKDSSLEELMTATKLLARMRANLNVSVAQPNDPAWDLYNKYCGMQDRIDDIIQGKMELLEVDCPEEWVGKSE